MEYIVKRTTECSQEELVQMNDLFNSVFERERPLEIMMNQYTQNPFGYSYHSLMIDNVQIVGMNVYVPVYFLKDREKVLFGDSIDSMVSKPYRDFFNYNDMVQAAYKYMRKEGVKFAYGYPNDNAYPVVIKSKLMKEVGRMYTYCLPYRIGGVKKSLGWLKWATMLFCRTWLEVASLFASSEVKPYRIEKDLESYNASRYKRSDGNYSFGDGFVYKVMDYEGIRTAFLIDVYEKSAKNFCKAIKTIFKKERQNFDILLYPGHLRFAHYGMIKIPHKYEPKRFVLTGKLLDKSFEFEGFWDINNWDTNLSNYDLI